MVNTTYTVSERHRTTSKRGTLIDRGANGGLVGSDVRCLSTTDRMVDVQGIDNHQLTNIPIVTAAGLVQTQRGPVVIIMNQYARVLKGKTIHSSAQMESHGMHVDDKSVTLGDHQRIITPCSYVIPLQVWGGLVYMDIRPPTDNDMDTLPQIILTSDLDWIPSSIDFEHDPKHGLTTCLSYQSWNLQHLLMRLGS